MTEKFHYALTVASSFREPRIVHLLIYHVSLQPSASAVAFAPPARRKNSRGSGSSVHNGGEADCSRSSQRRRHDSRRRQLTQIVHRTCRLCLLSTVEGDSSARDQSYAPEASSLVHSSLGVIIPHSHMPLPRRASMHKAHTTYVLEFGLVLPKPHVPRRSRSVSLGRSAGHLSDL